MGVVDALIAVVDALVVVVVVVVAGVAVVLRKEPMLLLWAPRRVPRMSSNRRCCGGTPRLAPRPLCPPRPRPLARTDDTGLRGPTGPRGNSCTKTGGGGGIWGSVSGEGASNAGVVGAKWSTPLCITTMGTCASLHCPICSTRSSSKKMTCRQESVPRLSMSMVAEAMGT